MDTRNPRCKWGSTKKLKCAAAALDVRRPNVSDLPVKPLSPVCRPKPAVSKPYSILAVTGLVRFWRPEKATSLSPFQIAPLIGSRCPGARSNVLPIVIAI